jgi:enamine deaminase RidA (YjgF/YER057c/UK114 family)
MEGAAMRKKMIEDAAFEVATQIRTVEETIDTALAEMGELQAKIIRVRSVSGTGVSTGHGAFEELAASVQALVAARGGIARCHAELAEARRNIPGLRTVAFGDHECPDEPMAQAHLRVVA